MAFVTSESRGRSVQLVKSLVGASFPPLFPRAELLGKHLNCLSREKEKEHVENL